AASSGGGMVTEQEAGAGEWLARGGTRTLTVLIPTSGVPSRVEIDPRQLLPDADRGNNVWPPPPSP
ncbi:MAG TPA: hypothetical protein VF771_00815, partial [Longimicrobiaceae bacterium]